MAWEVLDLGEDTDPNTVEIEVKERTFGRAAGTSRVMTITLGRRVAEQMGLKVSEETDVVEGKVHIQWGTGPQEGIIRVVPMIKTNLPGIEIRSIKKGQLVRVGTRRFPANVVPGYTCTKHMPDEFNFSSDGERPFLEIELPEGFFPPRTIADLRASQEVVHPPVAKPIVEEKVQYAPKSETPPPAPKPSVPLVDAVYVNTEQLLAEARLRIGTTERHPTEHKMFLIGRKPDQDKMSLETLLRSINTKRHLVGKPPMAVS